MNIAALPFDSEQMLAGLKPWVECESPTYDAAAVERCARAGVDRVIVRPWRRTSDALESIGRFADEFLGP